MQQSNPDGTGLKTVLYFDPTIVWFSHKHIPYMVAAMVPFIFLVLIPSLLLCVYPTRIYRCLSRFVSGRKRLAITAFAEALHNCYKDGLNGTRDYRAMAGLNILAFPVSAVIIYAVRKTIANGYSAEAASGYTLVFISLVISYVRPCKKTIANLSLSYHFMMLGILSIALHLWQHDMSTGTEALEGTFIVIPIISHILVFLWVMYTIIHRIMSHYFGYHDCKVALIDMVNGVKQCFYRGHGGYVYYPIQQHNKIILYTPMNN